MREIVGKASVSLVARVAGTALNFLLQILLGRMLGAHGVGIYYLALTIITFMTLAARLGMDYNLTRVVAGAAEDQNWGNIRRFTSYALKVGVAVAVFAAIALFLSANWVSVEVFSKPDLVVPLRIMAVAIVPFAVLVLISRALQGLKRVGMAMILETVITPMLACALFLVFVTRLQISGAALAFTLATTTAALLAFGLWQRLLQKEDVNAVAAATDSTSSFLRNSMPLLGVLVFQQIAQILPLLVLGALGTASDIGVFYAAHRTAALVGLILLAANSIIAPKFAALYHKRETTTLDEVMRNSAMFMTAAAAPAILLFFLVPEFVISIFGRDFTEGGDLLRVLAIGQMFNVITGSVGFMLMMTDNSRSLFIVTLSMVVVNVVLSFSLIPSYGAMGAAIAASASLLTASVMRVFYVWRTLGFLALPIPFSVRASSRTM